MSIYLLSPLKREGTIALPMIKFTLKDTQIDFTNVDLLLFTSKQAVISAEALNTAWKNIPCLAIGRATAMMIESLGGRVIHQPNAFYAKILSEEIVRLFKDKHILYLRPNVVSFDSKAFFSKAGLQIEEKIIYETSCIKYTQKDKPIKNAIIIFTSPSTIHCFLENFEWDESYRAVVIGEASKEYLPLNVQYEVADKPLIDACVSKAKQILLTSNPK